MTFLELQNAVMDRLNLTSTEARTRIKKHINLRLREVVSTVNLTRTRRSTKTWTTTSGNPIVSGTGIAKVFNLRPSGVGSDMLPELGYEQIRQADPSDLIEGIPKLWAVRDHRNDYVALKLQPIPNATLTFYSDILASGTDLSADGDEPTIPVDFQDALVVGAEADELYRMEKSRPLAVTMEAKFEKRLSELRYFVHKNTYEARHQSDSTQSVPRRLWPNNTL